MPDLCRQKVGDVQSWATKELHDVLERIVNAKSYLQVPYYILVWFQNHYEGPPRKCDNHILHGRRKPKTGQTQTMDLSGKKVLAVRPIITFVPPQMPLLNTALWRIDNKTGEVRCIYVLPPDKPLVGNFELTEESATVGKSAQGMPVYYG